MVQNSYEKFKMKYKLKVSSSQAISRSALNLNSTIHTKLTKIYMKKIKMHSNVAEKFNIGILKTYLKKNNFLFEKLIPIKQNLDLKKIQSKKIK